jgi:Na+-driven multidrug efflux pump
VYDLARQWRSSFTDFHHGLLGVTGAGVATLTSFTASSAFLAWYIVCGRTPLTLPWRALRLERRFFAEILRVGGPMSLQPVLNNVALATLTGFVGMSGPVALAAFGAAVRLEYVLYPLTFGFGAAVLAMVGTNLGAGQVARASRITWTAGALGLALTGGVGLVGLLWPGIWIGLFSTNPDVHALATSYMCIAGLAYPFIGLGLPLSSALQAAGRPLWPLLGVASRVLVVAAGGWIVVHMTGTGLGGLGVVSALGITVHGSMLAVVCGRVWRLSASATYGNRPAMDS